MATVKHKDLTASKGNRKLDKSVLIWNIPAVKTCPNCKDCKDKCYARKAEKMYPTVLPCRERNYQASKESDFTSNMLVLIDKSKCKVVRIHESGDFYDQEYADKWTEIANSRPDVAFYAYTKSPYRPTAKNLNIVESFLPGGEVNFTSDRRQLTQWSRTYKAAICPAGLSKKHVVCGKDCKACQTKKYVVFLMH